MCCPVQCCSVKNSEFSQWLQNGGTHLAGKKGVVGDFSPATAPSNVREWIVGTKSEGGGHVWVMKVCHLRIICPFVKGKFKLDSWDFLFLKMDRLICSVWQKVEMWHSNPHSVSSQLFCQLLFRLSFRSESLKTELEEEQYSALYVWSEVLMVPSLPREEEKTSEIQACVIPFSQNFVVQSIAEGKQFHELGFKGKQLTFSTTAI